MMRSQKHNPFFKKYGPRLSGNLYNPNEVLVFYNEDAEYRVRDVEVVYKPDAGGPVKEKKLYSDFAAYSKKWSCDLPISNDETAAEIFGHLLQKGFSSRQEAEDALKEFACIQGCGWADEMLRSFI